MLLSVWFTAATAAAAKTEGAATPRYISAKAIKAVVEDRRSARPTGRIALLGVHISRVRLGGEREVDICPMNVLFLRFCPDGDCCCSDCDCKPIILL